VEQARRRDGVRKA
jgi:hypothetical protein